MRLAHHLNASTFARFSYFALVIITTLVLLVSCVFILSQAVRTAPNKDWTRNVNAVVVGGAYILVLVISLAFCLKRRLSGRLRLGRIPKGRVAIGKGDVPKSVHNFIEGEFLRSCAIVHAAQPKVPHRDGWGAPGTKHENVRFRTAILDTVPQIDHAARRVIPSIPPLSPHITLARHLRHIAPLISADPNGESYFQSYTDAVETAKYSERELSAEEFEGALDAAETIREILETYQKVLHEKSP